MKDYRGTFYARYQTAFKHEAGPGIDYRFTDGKLVPLIRSWCAPLDRASPCLDLGCGNGALLHALRSLGFTDLRGVDLSAEQVALAQEVEARVEQGTIVGCLSACPDGSLGLVTLFDVIEHLTKEEIVELVELIHRKLRPGGIWLCHLPNGDSPWIGSIQAGDFTHQTMLNPMSARNLCEVFGFGSFAAVEHLGASDSLTGGIRRFGWRGLRAALRLWNRIETGQAGSGIHTRVFAFKAAKPVTT